MSKRETLEVVHIFKTKRSMATIRIIFINGTDEKDERKEGVRAPSSFRKWFMTTRVVHSKTVVILKLSVCWKKKETLISAIYYAMNSIAPFMFCCDCVFSRDPSE